MAGEAGCVTHVMCSVMQCGGLHVACNSDDSQPKNTSGKNRKHSGGSLCLCRRSGCDGLCHVIVSSFPSHPTGSFHCAWQVSWLTDRSCFAAFPVAQWRVRKALSALQSRGRLWFLASRFGSAFPHSHFIPLKLSFVGGEPCLTVVPVCSGDRQVGNRRAIT